MRIPNYGDSGNERRRKLGGYHPPACTCYRCNEERRAKETAEEEERRAAALERLIEREDAWLRAQSRTPAPKQNTGNAAPATNSSPIASARQGGRVPPLPPNRLSASRLSGSQFAPPARPVSSGRSGKGPGRGFGIFLLWLLIMGVVGSLAGTCLYTSSGNELPPASGDTGMAAGDVVSPTRQDPAYPTGTTRAAAPTTQAPTPELAPTRQPTPSRQPTPTHPLPTESELAAAKELMLHRINSSRVHAGLRPVVMGDNPAAQIHAENSLAGCFSSHWGLDGTKPYMRYFLAGGYQTNAENVAGHNFCLASPTGHPSLRDIEFEIRNAMLGLMGSPGHRDTILNTTYRKVNLGLAWDRYNLQVVQHFEGDYVEFGHLPTFEDGVLRFKGKLHGGAEIAPDKWGSGFGVQIFYDPPLRELTQGQLARVYCYGHGRLVAVLRSRAGSGYSYDSDDFTACAHDHSIDPQDISPDVHPPITIKESTWLHNRAAASVAEEETNLCEIIVVPWIDASRWFVGKDSFEVRANMGDVLDEHGPGIYTVVLWADVEGERVPVGEYPVFHDTEPPDGYGPGRD